MSNSATRQLTNAEPSVTWFADIWLHNVELVGDLALISLGFWATLLTGRMAVVEEPFLEPARLVGID